MYSNFEYFLTNQMSDVIFSCLNPFSISSLTIFRPNSLFSLKAGIDFDDLEFEDPDKYSGYEAYCLSKLANLLTARKLARKYKGKINTYAVHPGNVKTEIGRNELSLGYRIVETVFFKPFQAGV